MRTHLGSYLDIGHIAAVVAAEGVTWGAWATNLILPSLVFIQPWASTIGVCGVRGTGVLGWLGVLERSGTDWTLDKLSLESPDNVASGKMLVVPVRGSMGLGGKFPRPLTTNLPKRRAAVPLGQVWAI